MTMTIEELANLLKKLVAKKEKKLKQIILSKKERDFLENHLDKMLSRRYHNKRVKERNESLRSDTSVGDCDVCCGGDHS